jgi:hypothetical protein
MHPTILFTEKQKMNQWWIWFILLALNTLFVYGIIQQVFMGIPFGDKPMNNMFLILVFLFVLVLTIFILLIRLETIIDQEGISVRLFPMHLSFKKFLWTDIEQAYLREYAPLKEFGGWGIKYSLSNYGTAYTSSGNQGLQLVLKDKRQFLIGTQKWDELTLLLAQRSENNNSSAD